MLAYLMFWRQIIVLAASLQCNFEVGQHRCVGVLEDTFDYIYICKYISFLAALERLFFIKFCILHAFSPIITKKTDQFSLLICPRWILRFPILPFEALQGNYLCVT